MRRSRSILSLSLFRYPTAAGNDVHKEGFKVRQQPDRYRTLPKESEAEWPKRTSSVIPPIPPRPPGQLFHRSLLELTHAVAGRDDAAPSDVLHHRASRGRLSDSKPVRRLGELDLDKRGNAFSRIQPDGWLKVIPKTWVEDNFSEDGVRSSGSRSSYSQEDQEVVYSTGQACPLYTATMDDVRPRTSSCLLGGEEPERADIWDEARVETLIPAPLRSRRVRPAKDKPARELTHEASNAASCRSVWSSVLCDKDSDGGSEGKNGGSQHCNGRTGIHHTEQETTFDMYNGDDQLTVDIDEILDLYLTPDREKQKKKVQVPNSRQPQWEKIIHIDPTLTSPLGQRYIPSPLMGSAAETKSMCETTDNVNRYHQPANSEVDQDIALSRDSSMSMTLGSVRRRASTLTWQAHPTFTRVSGQGRGWSSSPLREQKLTQNRVQEEAIAVRSPTAAVTFLDENGQAWI
ncbi:hypothetical protein LTR99_005503 [Exophiala xenobiotica]|uniref:Uncharacterized protein n=1 Tax=Vermiconidia calcicola TaxID=1690605 RepID=A0AAV9Q9L3_9PEZI|nr:hypothetical protein LTR99_005503 [Exophiala xenobiotica]KAK5436843.1 hypothetical protein LTR34_002474 [Exophiala xenobiotica]KAK5535738.1 hypothetical protein LTR25_005640 [Vermiconidia calcicola]KAK5548679.1 hypothetical protein LTR23_001168 [Chaetothyriales sp. CCFEE 6169]